MSFGRADFVGVSKHCFELFFELSIASEDTLSFVVLSFRVRIVEIVAHNRFEPVECVASEKSGGTQDLAFLVPNRACIESEVCLHLREESLDTSVLPIVRLRRSELVAVPS